MVEKNLRFKRWDFVFKYIFNEFSSFSQVSIDKFVFVMMNFPLEDDFGLLEDGNEFESVSVSMQKRSLPKAGKLHICSEKIRIPEFEKMIRLPRLTKLLEKSERRFAATLIVGRSGTGKTALAAGFARQHKNAAWYSIESADCDWSVFSGYLGASLFGEDFEQNKFSENLDSAAEPEQTTISRCLTRIFAEIETGSSEKPFLIVLDNLHYIFDCGWFEDFFNLLLNSLPPDTHLLLLSRSKPPVALWRLRSKQVLNVIDEKLLALNPDEAEELYKNFGLSGEKARKAFRASLGRISKLMNLAASR